MKLPSVIQLKVVTAFSVPFALALTSGMGAYTEWPGAWLAGIVFFASAAAGANGVSLFLSRTYADHVDGTDVKPAETK
jgi:hypothetical protein